MKDTRTIYWTWTWAFRSHTTLCLVLETILTLSLNQRKDLLGLARTQSPVLPGSYLEKSITTLYDNILVPQASCSSLANVRYESMSMKAFIDLTIDAFLTPIPASIISLATRISPNTTEEEYRNLVLAAISKEITAAINLFPHTAINYATIFDSQSKSRHIPFTDRMPSQPDIAIDTHRRFVEIRRSLCNRMFYPSAGKKTVGRIVADNFWTAYHASGLTFKHEGMFEPEDQVTTRDCLKLYEKTGGYVDGPVEMRCSWKYAQIGPRIYYARGGSVVQTSQYIQPIVNMIIDSFPETHRMNRFSPPDSMLDETDVEVIYDYSSFTSLADAVVGFVNAMADFFSGTPVVLVDPRNGPATYDLGDLLKQYNQCCNCYASFDTSRVLSAFCEDPPILQHTCGMLGVEGNIFLATLLHGIHLRFIAGLGRSRCVGDDARAHVSTEFGVLSIDDMSYLSWVLSGIGDISLEKLGKFELNVNPLMQAYRYIKRPIHRDFEIMVEGVLFDVPSLIPLFALADRFHTILPSETHPCRATFKSIIRMLRVLKLHNISKETSPDGISIIADHIQFLLAEIRRQDPGGVHSPFGRSDIITKYRIPSVNDWGRIDYEDWIMNDLAYDQEVRFLKRGGVCEGVCDGRIGSEMIREASQGRAFLTKLGYMIREDMFDVVSIASIGPDEMRTYLSGSYRAVSRYRVVEDIPLWYSTLPEIL